MKHTDRTGLVEQILKEDLNLTNEQVAVAAGLTEEQGIQLWRNLGFPDPGAISVSLILVAMRDFIVSKGKSNG